MTTTVITLVGSIILFTAISFGSFVSLSFGIINKRKILWAISLPIFLSSVCLLSVMVGYTSAKVVNRSYITSQPLSETRKVSGSGIRFTKFTGLEWPENAKVIATGDEYWLFEWEYYLVFETDREVLEK